MNKIYSESRCVAPCGVRNVVAELIFLLISQHRKRGDGRNKLIVAEGLKSRDRTGSRAKRKRQGETQIRVARLRVMQAAGFKNECAEPGGAESVVLIEQKVQVIRV